MGDLPILSLCLPESTDDVSKDIKAAGETHLLTPEVSKAHRLQNMRINRSRYQDNENAITQREIIFTSFVLRWLFNFTAQQIAEGLN